MLGCSAVGYSMKNACVNLTTFYRQQFVCPPTINAAHARTLTEIQRFARTYILLAARSSSAFVLSARDHFSQTLNMSSFCSHSSTNVGSRFSSHTPHITSCTQSLRFFRSQIIFHPACVTASETNVNSFTYQQNISPNDSNPAPGAASR